MATRSLADSDLSLYLQCSLTSAFSSSHKDIKKFKKQKSGEKPCDDFFLFGLFYCQELSHSNDEFGYMLIISNKKWWFALYVRDDVSVLVHV